MNSPADIWAKVLSLMENDMTATTINTWFDDARAVALEEDRRAVPPRHGGVHL